MRNFYAFIGAVALLTGLPGVSEAALSFDLNENPSYGYSTRTVGGFDAITQDVTVTGIPPLPTAVLTDTAGALTNDFSGVGSITSYADLEVTNSSTINGYSTNLNEFYINYALETTYVGAFGSVALYWSPTALAGSGDLTGFTLVSNDLAQGWNTLQFQGEDIYAAGGAAPSLLTNGSTGTLRFVFAAGGFAVGATGTQTLSAMSITAVVPEPSSALLLSGIVGCFAGFRRRRRALAAIAS